jgi:hypothetical protein
MFDLLWNKGYDSFEKYLRFTDVNTSHFYLTYISSLLYTLQSGENVIYNNQVNLSFSQDPIFLENILVKRQAIRLSALSKCRYRSQLRPGHQ